VACAAIALGPSTEGFSFPISLRKRAIVQYDLRAAGVDTSVQGTTTGFLITYGISDKKLKQVYGTNYGQPNVPICVGAQRIVNGHPLSCQNDDGRGWTGRMLDPDTHKWNGNFKRAICNPDDGLWWNIAPTFQDTPSPSPDYDAISIVISAWGSATASDGTALRTFTIFKPPPWDSKCYG